MHTPRYRHVPCCLFGARRSGSGSIQLRKTRPPRPAQQRSRPGASEFSSSVVVSPSTTAIPILLFFWLLLSTWLRSARTTHAPTDPPVTRCQPPGPRVEESKSPGSRVACCLGSLKCQRRGGQQGGQQQCVMRTFLLPFEWGGTANPPLKPGPATHTQCRRTAGRSDRRWFQEE